MEKKVRTSDYTEMVGYVGVDSGQVMIVDPCYLKEWNDNDFNYRTGIRNKKTGRIICCWDEVEGLGKINWATSLPEFDGKDMNKLAEDKENWEKFDEYPDAGDFSYSGVCGITCGEENAGEIAIGGSSCVASSTYLGDGSYPVYAVKDKYGRIKRLIIDFYGGDEYDDDETNN
jgi:hypothetical protein